jgi:hypothetical protein
MHPEVLEEEALNLTNVLGFLDRFGFYLVGGTGLALQWGHRKSVDFVFFNKQEFTPDVLSSVIREKGVTFTERAKAIGTLHCLLNGIKTSFIFYNEPLIYKAADFNALKIADSKDTVVEKARTIADRGLKKDFYDFYTGVKKFGIETLVDLVYQKFGNRINYLTILRGLTYFEDAERSKEELIFLQDVESWENIKKYFTTHIREFEKAFLQKKGF